MAPFPLNTDATDDPYEKFEMEHADQLVAAAIPPKYWSTIYKKLVNETFDAGSYFQILAEETGEGTHYSVVALKDIDVEDPNSIFLIDHAWTFRPQIARQHLREIPGLLERVSAVFDIDLEPQESDMPIWYMPDEFGVRIGHSDEPNFRMLPMFYHAQHAAYSLLFPLKKVNAGEVITRDYVDTPIMRSNPNWRSILLHPWIPINLANEKVGLVLGTDELFTVLVFLVFINLVFADTLPAKDFKMTLSVVPPGIVRVFADDYQFIDRMKEVKVEKVDRMEDADVIWWRGHFHDYKLLSERNPNAFVNQFPDEAVLTVKDLLAASIQAAYSNETMRWPPRWFETTFNLKNALPQFVTYFQQRQLRGLDNTWIVKPWNLARGLDMHVTNNLSYIIRLVESGPKIACKYIHRPLLFMRPDNGNLVKFDLRYIILVTSLKPLKLMIYNNFWIRFAINEFDLHELDDRETHFTVFNYDYKSKILQMRCEDFIASIEKQYTTLKWSEIQLRINKVIAEVLTAVSSGEAPRSIMPDPQSRAMYGVDIMLKWDSDDVSTRNLEVSFIEANFMPDCERACDYYENFADSAFNALFMGKVDPKEFTELIS
uniref:Tubulin--tyrosine ligase-like protein 12 n=1 Tax=Syphacia muris TaxID=451379 RepID=A0A0N5AHM6_9BILA